MVKLKENYKFKSNFVKIETLEIKLQKVVNLKETICVIYP